MAKFLKRDDVSKIIKSNVNTPHTCPKCNGTGYIESFYYYADGVCFRCIEIGIVGELSVLEVKTQEQVRIEKENE